jgi:hypothetical protein
MSIDTTSVDVRTAGSQRLGVDLWERWTAMWNGDLSIAEQLVSDGFRIHFGNATDAADTDSLRGPGDLSGFIAAHRTARPGLSYRTDGVPIVALDMVDGQPTGRLACRWTVTRPDGTGATIHKSGIDILAIAGGRVTEVWSITGDRLFA